MKLNEQVEREFFGMKPYASIDVKCLYPQHGEAMDAYVTMLFPNRQKTMLYDREGVSFPVQIALLHPIDDEPFYFAYTMGMSAAPMVGPAESMECETLYSELCLLIPNNWFCHCAEKDIAQSWPLEMMRALAKFPHANGLWMSNGFMLPNTENEDAFSKGTEYCGVLIIQFDGDLGHFTADDGTQIKMLMPIPLYRDEMELFENVGGDELAERIVTLTKGSFIVAKDRPHATMETDLS